MIANFHEANWRSLNRKNRVYRNKTEQDTSLKNDGQSKQMTRSQNKTTVRGCCSEAVSEQNWERTQLTLERKQEILLEAWHGEESEVVQHCKQTSLGRKQLNWERRQLNWERKQAQLDAHGLDCENLVAPAVDKSGKKKNDWKHTKKNEWDYASVDDKNPFRSFDD